MEEHKTWTICCNDWEIITKRKDGDGNINGS